MGWSQSRTAHRTAVLRAERFTGQLAVPAGQSAINEMNKNKINAGADMKVGSKKPATAHALNR